MYFKIVPKFFLLNSYSKPMYKPGKGRQVVMGEKARQRGWDTSEVQIGPTLR